MKKLVFTVALLVALALAQVASPPVPEAEALVGLPPQLLMTVTIGQVGPPEPPLPVFNGKKLGWDWEGLDALGNPEMLSHYIVSLTPITATTPVGSTLKSINVPNGTALRELMFDQLIVGVADGNYKVFVQAVDLALHPSEPSVPLPGRSDLTDPATATNLRFIP